MTSDTKTEKMRRYRISHPPFICLPSPSLVTAAMVTGFWSSIEEEFFRVKGNGKGE
jgi:hypothetical protein